MQIIISVSYTHLYTEKDGTEFISGKLNAEQGSTFAFAIIVDGKVAGSIGAFRQANIHSRTAEMGYYIGEEYLSLIHI